MRVEEIMVKDAKLISPDAIVTKAFGIMKNNRIHQLVVLDGKNLLGMIELKKLVTGDMDPHKTKIQNYVTKTPIIGPKENVEKCIELLLNSGSRAMPVVDRGIVVGIISETDIIKHAKKTAAFNNPAKGLSTRCVYAEKSDSVGKIKHMMLQNNVSRVPVLDNGKIIGIVDTLDLIRVFEAMDKFETHGRDFGLKDKIHLESAPAETIMSKTNVLGTDATIGDVIEGLKHNEGVIIGNGDVCIVTPKDILELFVTKPKKGIYVQITGLHNEDTELAALLDKETDTFVKKMGKFMNNIEYLFIHVERMHKAGKNIKYSVRTRFSTPIGLFVSHAWGWNALNIAQEAINKLEDEVTKKHEKLQDHYRARKTKMFRRG